MTMVTILAPDGSEQQAVDDSQLQFYPGWTVVADSAPHDDEAVIVNGSWTVPIEVLQARLWGRVKAIRAEKETGIAQTPVGAVQIDEASKAKIMGALAFARLQEEQGKVFSMNFTLADNTRVDLNSTTVRQLAGAAGLYVSQLYDYSWTFRDAIFADGVTADDLAAIDAEAGWP